MNKMMEEVAREIRDLKIVIPSTLNPKLERFQSRAPFKIICLRDSLIHRVVHLGEEAVRAYNNNSTVSFALLVRAILETSALMFTLDKDIARAIETGNTNELEDRLHKTTIGSRNDSTPETAVNALTCLGKLDKKYSGIRKYYDDLSEFCHPNFYGVLSAYSSFSEDGQFKFGAHKGTGIKLGVAPLKIGILIAAIYYDEIHVKYNELLRVCYSA